MKNYPACKTVDVVENWHGIELADPYAWLRDKDDPEVRDFVARENAYTDAYFATRGVDEKIAQLKATQLPENYMTVEPFGEGYVTSRSTDGGGYDIAILDADFNETGTLKDLPGLGDLELFRALPAPDRTDIIGLFAQHMGAARPSVVVYDLERKAPVFKADGTFSIAWSRATGKIYYALTESNLETHECRSSWRCYDPASDTEETLFAPDENYIIAYVEMSGDGRWALFGAASDYSRALWYACDTASGEVHRLSEAPEAWQYIDSTTDGHCFVSTSANDHGEVVAVANDGSQRTVLAPQERFFLTGGFSCAGKLYALALEDVSARLIDVATGEAIELPDPMGELSVAGKDDARAFLSFQSFTMPPCILAFDGERFEKVYATSDATHPDIVVEQHFAPSTGDGTLVPYYLVRARDAQPDGTAPALMYAYGGYNSPTLPWYTELVSMTEVPRWVEAGGVYVHLNLRGGSEYGPAWHEAGMLDSKRHCYEDFIGVTEQLIKDGWASAGNIGIVGCSNGGLLMSALVTMRPDLWGCVIDSVPQTDMIHVADDDRGPMYITEYGDPRASKEMFEYLLSYSPYHNVQDVAYPPVYIQTGECDNNVPPYHGKKFAARVQAATTGDAPILLRVLAQGSHNRGGTPEEFWRTIAEMHLFLEEHLKGIGSC